VSRSRGKRSATTSGDLVSAQVFKSVSSGGPDWQLGLNHLAVWDGHVAKVDRSVTEQDDTVVRGLVASLIAYNISRCLGSIS
jgi:hypothetical protein